MIMILIRHFITDEDEADDHYDAVGLVKQYIFVILSTLKYTFLLGCENYDNKSCANGGATFSASSTNLIVSLFVG
jgi:hypothetical protein